MSAETSPLLFEKRLGMLSPANRDAVAAMTGVDGRVIVEFKRATRNQKRRSLYWVVVDIVADVLADLTGVTLTASELHDVAREKLGYCDKIVLPSGDIYTRLHSTSDRAMGEPERAIFTTKAFEMFAKWTRIPVETLTAEAQAKEAA